MSFKDLQSAARKLLESRPDLMTRIRGILEMAKDEIEAGGSESHEVGLALRDLNALGGA